MIDDLYEDMIQKENVALNLSKKESDIFIFDIEKLS